MRTRSGPRRRRSRVRSVDDVSRCRASRLAITGSTSSTSTQRGSAKALGVARVTGIGTPHARRRSTAMTLAGALGSIETKRQVVLRRLSGSTEYTRRVESYSTSVAARRGVFAGPRRARPPHRREAPRAHYESDTRSATCLNAPCSRAFGREPRQLPRSHRTDQVNALAGR